MSLLFQQYFTVLLSFLGGPCEVANWLKRISHLGMAMPKQLGNEPQFFSPIV